MFLRLPLLDERQLLFWVRRLRIPRGAWLSVGMEYLEGPRRGGGSLEEKWPWVTVLRRVMRSRGRCHASGLHGKR